jgi:hypothetical protein
MSLDTKIFEKKTLSDLLKEIHTNSTTNKSDIKAAIDTMLKTVETTADAVRLMPIVKDFMDVLVKNDEQLIKIAGVVQRGESKQPASEDAMYEELQKLLEDSVDIKSLPEPKVEEVK